MEQHEEVEGLGTKSIHSAVTEAACRQALEAARMQAARCGIRGEEVHDCAFAFLLHLLARSRRSADPAGLFPSDAWLISSANHWALNALRQQTNRCRVEVAWTNLQAEEQEGSPAEPVTAENGPERQILQAELIGRLCSVVRLLTPAQQELFLRHFLAEETINEIAQRTGKRAGTVRQALTTLRRRLRVLLQQAGMTVEEATEYLGLLRTGNQAHR